MVQSQNSYIMCCIQNFDTDFSGYVFFFNLRRTQKGWICKGGNSVKNIFALLHSEGKNMFSWEQILSF